VPPASTRPRPPPGQSADDVQVEVSLSPPPADAGRDGRAESLYERFRPGVPAGVGGWGAKGDLDLDVVRRLARRRAQAR